jgi:N-acetylglucosaminyldiphosphoundecaprenol N-acetyl-beta-D-mannosaminyltransferase
VTTDRKRLERFDVLDVGIDPLTPSSATQAITTLISEKRKGYVVFCTVSSILSARDDPEVARAIEGAELVTPDGMPLVWLGRRRSPNRVERVYGPDFMLDFFAVTGAQFSHYFYGGQPGVAETAVVRLRKRFPDLQVAGYSTPPVHVSGTADDDDAIRAINASGADIVWVGLGHPKQDLWMSTHLEHLNASVLAGVGAAFDFHAGHKKEAPGWMKKSGLQWLHRLASEPRRLWRRYLVGNTRFLFHLSLRGISRTQGKAPTADKKVSSGKPT